MKTEQPRIRISGESRPPADLMGAARKSMPPEEFEKFIAKFGEQFTPKQLVDYVTEMRNGPRH